MASISHRKILPQDPYSGDRPTQVLIYQNQDPQESLLLTILVLANYSMSPI